MMDVSFQYLAAMFNHFTPKYYGITIMVYPIESTPLNKLAVADAPEYRLMI